MIDCAELNYITFYGEVSSPEHFYLRFSTLIEYSGPHLKPPQTMIFVLFSFSWYGIGKRYVGISSSQETLNGY